MKNLSSVTLWMRKTLSCNRAQTMDEIIIKFSFILSMVFMLTGYFTGMGYEAFLIRGVIIFLVSTFALILTHVLIVKHLISAKIEVLQEDFVNTYNIIKTKREQRIQEIQDMETEENELLAKAEAADKAKRAEKSMKIKQAVNK